MTFAFRPTHGATTRALHTGMLVLASSLLTGAAAYADLLAYDPFLIGDNPALGQYLAGDENSGVNVLGGQNPFIGPTAFYGGPWIQSGGDSQVVKNLPSYSYPGLPAGLGGIQQETIQFNCCSFGRSGRSIAGGLGFGAAETIYQSFLIDFGTQGTDIPTDFGFRGHELWNGGIGDANRSIGLYVNHFAGINELSLEVTTASGTSFDAVNGGGLTLDAMEGVHFVVMKYEFNPVAADRVSVYFDPTIANGEPVVPSAQISVATSDLFITHHGAFTQFTFSGGGHIPGGIDEMRWGTDFNSVIPAPGGLALLALSAAPLGRRRRRIGPAAVRTGCVA